MVERTGWLMSLSGLPSPVPWSAGSGIWYFFPSWTTFSRRHTLRQISITSRVRASGASYFTPWKPSTTCGPEAPRPSTNRPSETKSSPAAVMAVSVGVRV